MEPVKDDDAFEHLSYESIPYEEALDILRRTEYVEARAEMPRRPVEEFSGAGEELYERLDRVLSPENVMDVTIQAEPREADTILVTSDYRISLAYIDEQLEFFTSKGPCPETGIATFRGVSAQDLSTYY